MNSRVFASVPIAAAVLAIAATYVYFLLFAEFALLGLAEPRVTAGLPLRVTMGVLGAGGVAGSLLAGFLYRRDRLRAALASGFAASALAAVASLVASAAGPFLVATALVGTSLGWLTITLVTGLRDMLGDARLGWWCGAGTGLAYAICNIPAVFTAGPRAQAIGGAIAAAVGLVCVLWIRPTPTAPRQDTDQRFPSRALWLVVLLALVWIDSAAFYVIQHTPSLKTATWTGNTALIENALVHFGAALLAGAALDKGWAGRLLALATLLLAAACLLLADGSTGASARFLYTAGVSIYSTALVYYPARAGRAWLSVVLYAVAGWCGSALGIGMAQDLQGVPRAFVLLAAVVVLAALALRWARLRGSGATAALAIALLGVTASPSHAAENSDPQVAAGRRVYIAEGCIHCHSQYVRPRVQAEVTQWGPARTLSQQMSEAPPLLGNRRQGPDLSTVGNRRSAEWQRLHLIDPAALLPGSRMPSYAYLFSGEDSPGDALVTYLTSLGQETLGDRLAQNARWTPAAGALEKPDLRQGAVRFTALCSSCHGATGAADGPLTPKLLLRPPDFTRDAWRRLDPADPAPLVALARIVKFGLPGAAMAGHEYLSDAATVELAAYVQSLHK